MAPLLWCGCLTLALLAGTKRPLQSAGGDEPLVNAASDDLVGGWPVLDRSSASSHKTLRHFLVRYWFTPSHCIALGVIVVKEVPGETTPRRRDLTDRWLGAGLRVCQCHAVYS